MEKLSAHLRPEQYHSLLEVIRYVADRHGPFPGFSCLGRTLNYSEVDTLSDKFAAFLQNSTPLEEGDRIALQLPNLLQFPIALYGALKAGMVVVNTNPMYTAPEMLHQFRDSGVKAIVVLENLCGKLERILPETQIETVIITRLGDMQPLVKGFVINFISKYVKKLVPVFSLANSCTFGSCLANDHQLKPLSREPTADDVALILYTGGTTGVAKGAMLSHGNLIANTMQLRARCLDLLDDQQETVAAPLPLYHSYAFLMHCLVIPYSGNHSVLILNPRDTDGFVKLLRSTRFSALIGISTFYMNLLRHAGFDALSWDAMKLCGAGGTALSSSVMEQWQRRTGCEILEGYGLTECSPGVTVNIPGAIRAGTVGIPLPETELRVVDSNGIDVTKGDSGELWVRGPQVMLGYWGQDDATKEALTADGWFKTGDIVTIDSEGYVSIVDRKKDMILVSGFNVYPNEVEDWVNRHPEVIESAAIGITSEETGEAVRLYVVREGDSLDAQAVIAHCREGLAAYKIPRDIEFIPDLPKSIVGKVIRRDLRSLAAG